jgi:L-2-hydroxyglutarate oxidase LhgO
VETGAAGSELDMTESVECVVVGAGVVGLAIARALALAGREVIVLEKADAIGTETSSRNSEVIHAGIYYQAGSLKAQFCVAGKHALYRYCAEHGVPHRRCTKLIVATRADQLGELELIRTRARANGVDDLTFLTAEAARALEPQLDCVGALLSPSTGIIDSHALMLAYRGDAEAAGAMIAFEAPFLGGVVESDGIGIEIGGAEPMTLRTRILINAAGLGGHDVARRLRGLDPRHVPTLHFAKGNYFSLSGRAPFSRLVYPVPEPGGLGVHITIDLAGQARFGPDVEWIDRIDYDVDPARAGKFYAAVRRYWPGLIDGALQPSYSGIRPKLGPAGTPAADFVIQGPETHGVRGLVNLFGIESPGLTASPAVAAHVLRILS